MYLLFLSACPSRASVPSGLHVAKSNSHFSAFIFDLLGRSFHLTGVPRGSVWHTLLQTSVWLPPAPCTSPCSSATSSERPFGPPRLKWPLELSGALPYFIDPSTFPFLKFSCEVMCSLSASPHWQLRPLRAGAPVYLFRRLPPTPGLVSGA